MIEVKYYYIPKSGKIQIAYAYFHSAAKALRFIYKCKNSKNMVFDGEFSCDDPLDTQYLLRKIR